MAPTQGMGTTLISQIYAPTRHVPVPRSTAISKLALRQACASPPVAHGALISTIIPHPCKRSHPLTPHHPGIWPTSLASASVLAVCVRSATLRAYSPLQDQEAAQQLPERRLRRQQRGVRTKGTSTTTSLHIYAFFGAISVFCEYL